MEVRILKKKVPPDTPNRLKNRLAADLERILPADAFAFALPDGEDSIGPRKGLPGIVIVHRGRALGLELGKPGHHLNDDQRTIFPRLRAAGMRIEVVRSFAEALAVLSEMGLELSMRESLSRQVAEIFRGAQRGRP
ncbi:MAG TPA: hypothetical protein VN935_03810 [Rhizomicrobium sp.]|jgi:hypothetical protein|nr:hypothetical protein [Rhizomicrobium sp.]